MAWGTASGEHFLASNPVSTLAASVALPAAGTTLTGGSLAGPFVDNGGAVYSAKHPTFGIKGDGKIVNDAAITTGQNILTSASAVFKLADVGKAVTVDGAGAAAAVLVTTISGFTNATTVTLAANAGTTVTNARLAYGTDDAAAIAAAIALVAALGGSALLFPAAIYMVLASMNLKSYVSIFGVGWASIINDGTGNFTQFALQDQEGVEVSNLRFTGTGNVGNQGRAAIFADKITTYGTRKSRFVRNWFDTVGTCGIVLANSDHCVVAQNYFNGTKEHGVYFSVSTYSVCGLNIIQNAGLNTTGAAVYGIKVAGGSKMISLIANEIDAPHDEGIIFDTAAVNCVALANVIQGCPQRGVRIISSCNSITVEGNVIQDSSQYDIMVHGGTGHLIKGNTCLNSGAASGGIRVDAGTCTVEGNVIPAGNAFEYAIRIVGGTNVVVQGNTIAVGVALGIQVVAGAIGTRLYFNHNFATTKYVDAGTGTIILDPANPGGAAALATGGSPQTITAGATPEFITLDGARGAAGTLTVVKNTQTIYNIGNSEKFHVNMFLDPLESFVVTFTTGAGDTLVMNRDKK